MTLGSCETRAVISCDDIAKRLADKYNVICTGCTIKDFLAPFLQATLATEGDSISLDTTVTDRF